MTTKAFFSLCFIYFFCLNLFGQNLASDFEPIIPEIITSIEFDQTEFNFGDIKEGEIIQNVFTFTNTGDEPLVITSAKATCGCSVPRWPAEPIMPGEKGEILVQFDSKNKGKVGGQIQVKRITISANTDPVNNYVTIKGKVHIYEQEQPQRHDYFDIDAGSIKLFPNPSSGQVQLDLSEYAGKSALIEIYNVIGERQSIVSIDELNSETVQVDVSNYEPGPYTFSISMEGHNRIAKIVVVQ